MGTSSAFFTFISESKSSRLFFISYFVWMLFQFLLPILFIWLILPDSMISTIWLHPDRELVLLAFVASFLQNQWWNLAVALAESVRQTLLIQTLNILVQLFYFIAVVVLAICGNLTIENVYLIIGVQFLTFSLLAFFKLKLQTCEESKTESLRSIFNRYKSYCAPLLPYTLLGFVVQFLDAWFLQNFGGATQQAFYAVGAQFAAVSLIFTTSILKVYWKEIAEAHKQDNWKLIENLYRKFSQGLFFIAAFISIFAIPWSETILGMVLGNSYVEGTFAFMLMLCYPIHQTLGQINGALFFATKKTTTYVVMGTINLLLGLVLAYFLLAPQEQYVPGLALGAVGLALKMVLAQLIAVNIGSYLIEKVLGLTFQWQFQIRVVLVMSVASLICYYLATWLEAMYGYTLVWLITSFLLYLGIVMAGFLLVPGIFGKGYQEIRDVALDYLNDVRSKFNAT